MAGSRHQLTVVQLRPAYSCQAIRWRNRLGRSKGFLPAAWTLLLPHETLDQTISCTKYETKPANAPTKAMPLLAATDPVKINPISIMVKNPAICHVTAFVKSLIVLSIGVSPRSGLSFHGVISDMCIWTLCKFAAIIPFCSILSAR